MQQVTGLFVFGKERSGTKWITNLIANHPQVACVQSEKHNGVHETNMFVQFPKAFGSLRVHENRLAFYHTFTNTFYFQITGVRKDWVFQQKTNSYLQFFDDFMNEFARIKSCDYWVQKTNSSNIGRIKRNFKTNKSIIIQRDLKSTLTSSLYRKSKNASVRQLITNTLRYVYLDRYERRFRHDSNVMIVNYGDLKKHTEKTLQQVFEFLGLDFNLLYTEVSFSANTTFYDQKRKTLSSTQLALVNITNIVARMLPMGFLKYLRTHTQHNRNAGRRFVIGTFD